MPVAPVLTPFALDPLLNVCPTGESRIFQAEAGAPMFGMNKPGRLLVEFPCRGLEQKRAVNQARPRWDQRCQLWLEVEARQGFGREE